MIGRTRYSARLRSACRDCASKQSKEGSFTNRGVGRKGASYKEMA